MSQGYSEIEIFNNIYHVNLGSVATRGMRPPTRFGLLVRDLLNPTEKAINTFTDAKIEERIRRMAEKDADTIQAEYEARLEEAVRVRHEIQRGRPFIVVDEMDKPVILRSLYPDMRDTFLSTRSNPHPLTPLNKKLHVSVTPVKTDHDTHRQCKGVIIPIQTFNDMQIEDEVKQFLSDILKKIKD